MALLKDRTEGAANKRSYGKKSRQEDDSWKTPLSLDQVNKLITKNTAELQRQIQKNALIAANAGVAEQYRYQPSQLISDVGFKERGFSWTYFQPVPGEFKIYPKGMRPWRIIFIHSFGYTWDIPYLTKNPSALHPPGDEYGHHPKRWNAGIQQLVTPKRPNPKTGKIEKVSIHFCISRRGDIMTSVGLNDLAQHGGGDYKYAIRGKESGGRPANNLYSIGIELEPCLGRDKPKGNFILLDYPDRQILSLAVLIKKLQAIRPIANTVISRFSSKATLKNQIAVALQTGGYIQHLDVFPVETRVDPNTGESATTGKLDGSRQLSVIDPGQFGVSADGSVGPGWTKLFSCLEDMKPFKLATDVFTDRLVEPDFSKLSAIASVMSQGNPGQQAVLGATLTKLQGYQRAANMQAQTRSTLSTNSITQAAVLNNAVAQAAASATTLVNRFNTANVQGITGDDLSYDFVTDDWVAGTTVLTE